MSEATLTQDEKTARRLFNEENRAAIAMGKSLGEYHQWRDQEVERWCNFLHHQMAELHADDPSEVLPQLATAVHERCTAEARKVAEATAKSVVAQLLRKAIA